MMYLLTSTTAGLIAWNRQYLRPSGAEAYDYDGEFEDILLGIKTVELSNGVGQLNIAMKEFRIIADNLVNEARPESPACWTNTPIGIAA